MVLRILTVVVMVVLLALPHPGSRAEAAGMSAEHLSTHAHHAAGGQIEADASHPEGHDGLTCMAICVGSPVVEATSVLVPSGRIVALWNGWGAVLSRALASPATPSRPPDRVIQG